MYAITGASGFIGSHLENLLKEKRIDYRKIGRKNDSDFIIRDINSETNWYEALKGVDTIFHLAGLAHCSKGKNNDKSKELHKEINFEGTKKLVKSALEMGVKKIIFLSTAKVYGEKSILGKKFDISSDLNPADEYAASKLQAENFLKTFSNKNDIDFVIVRTPIVYGPRMKANFYNLFYLVYTGLPLPFEKIENKKSIIYVGNLVDFLYYCALSKNALGKTFLISEKYSLSSQEIIKLISASLKVPLIIFPFPLRFLKKLAFILGKKNYFCKLTDSFEIDPSESYKILSWNPPFDFYYSFKITSEWFLKKVGKKF